MTQYLRNNDQAFSMLEVLVALTILAIVIGAYLSSLRYQTRLNYQNEVRSAAMQAAQQVLDELRTKDPTTMPSSGTDGPRTIDIENRTFTVVVSYCEQSAFCPTNDVRHLTVHSDYKNERRYSVQTIYTKLR